MNLSVVQYSSPTRKITTYPKYQYSVREINYCPHIEDLSLYKITGQENIQSTILEIFQFYTWFPGNMVPLKMMKVTTDHYTS